jgi:O-antigen ligase
MILFYLTLLLLILSPFTELLRFDLRNDVAVHVPDIIAGIVLFSWIVYLIVKKKFSKKIFVHPILLFLYVGIVSLLVNSFGLKLEQLEIASLYLLRWISYASLYFIIKQFSDRQKGRVIFVLLVEGFIIAILGYLQYFFYPSLRNLFYLGWDEHLYRLFSVFLDPNFAGIYLVLYFFLILGIFASQWKQFERKRKIVMSYLLLLILGAIVLTYSRTALLMLLTGVVLFLIFIKRKKWIILVALLSLGLVAILSPAFKTENTNLFRTASSKARLATSVDSLQIVQKSPLIGVGFDAYRYAQIRFGLRQSQTPFPSHADAGVDNSYLFVLATTGVVGFVSYLYLWYHFIRKTYFVYKQRRERVSLLIFCSVIAVLVSGLFINSLFYAPIMLWMWTLFAIIHPYEL